MSYVRMTLATFIWVVYYYILRHYFAAHPTMLSSVPVVTRLDRSRRTRRFLQNSTVFAELDWFCRFITFLSTTAPHRFLQNSIKIAARTRRFSQNSTGSPDSRLIVGSVGMHVETVLTMRELSRLHTPLLGSEKFVVVFQPSSINWTSLVLLEAQNSRRLHFVILDVIHKLCQTSDSHSSLSARFVIAYSLSLPSILCHFGKPRSLSGKVVSM